ncbi:hypothetical protein ACQKL5_14940 [Peribacillus sp. NPDC097675]
MVELEAPGVVADERGFKYWQIYIRNFQVIKELTLEFDGVVVTISI